MYHLIKCNCADSLFINDMISPLIVTILYCAPDATNKIFGYHLNRMERRKIIMVDCYASCGYQQAVMDIFASMKVSSDLYHLYNMFTCYFWRRMLELYKGKNAYPNENMILCTRHS